MKTNIHVKKIMILCCAWLLATMFAAAAIIPFDLSAARAQEQAAAAAAAREGIEVEDVTGRYSSLDSNLNNYDFSNSLYSADDTANVVVFLKDASILSKYLQTDGEYASVSKYATSKVGKEYASKLSKTQKTQMNSLSSKFNMETRHVYQVALNGFSANMRYGDVAKLRQDSRVKSVVVSEVYDVPDIGVVNDVNIYEETGIFDGSVVDYDGSGIVVGVLDTGLDYRHSAFNKMPSVARMTKSDVNAIMGQSSVNNYSNSGVYNNFNADNVYISPKVPFAYDYADGDDNVYPHDLHGMHVAGIIAGEDNTITGVAPGAQIAFFKVFSDYSSGATEDDILAALNDAVLLGVDVINMSLGSTGGYGEDINDSVKDVYNSVRDAGISLIVAAGNSGSSATNGGYGKNLTSSPDSSVMGEPASYYTAMGVASISGRKTDYALADNEIAIYFNEAASNWHDKVPFIEPLLGGQDTKEYEYVIVPGLGDPANYTQIDVRGKIAVVKRGITTFLSKVRTAMDNGAVAVIIYNNVSGIVNPTIGDIRDFPVASTSMDIGEKLAAKGSGTILFSKNNQAGPFMSQFSSWGVNADLELTPEITAHGGDITSAAPGPYDPVTGTSSGYATVSGTSMASPNMAGVAALLRQHISAVYPTVSRYDAVTLVNQLTMSTATIALNEEGNPYSPRNQGAGIADVYNAVNTRAYLYVDGTDKTKLSLGDDKEKTGVYTMSFWLKNTSKTAVSYEFDMDVFTETVSSDKKTVAERAYMLDKTAVSLAADAKASISKSGGKTIVTLGGMRETKLTVTLTLSDEEKQYLNESFENGMFVEGFAKLISLDANPASRIDLNVPFVAFYGDWVNVPFFDATYFEVKADEFDTSIKEEDKIKAQSYASRILGASGGTLLPLGEYVFTTPEGGYEPTPSAEKIAISTEYYANNTLYGVYAGLLRTAKYVDVDIINDVTGREVFHSREQYVRKSATESPSPIVFGENGIFPEMFELAENSIYSASITAYPNYEGWENAQNNTMSFKFAIDSTAPVLIEDSVKLRTRDIAGVKRYYLDFQVYDSQYIQAVNLSSVGFISNDGGLYDVVSLTDHYVPVEAAKGAIATQTYDITDKWQTILNGDDNLLLEMYDYALNGRQVLIKLPRNATGGIRFENSEGVEVNEISIDVNQMLDLKTMLKTQNEDASFYGLTWKTNNSEAVLVNDGEISGKKANSVSTVSVTDKEGNVASIKVSVTSNVAPVVPLNKIELSEEKKELYIGEIMDLSVNLKPWNITNIPELIWYSSDDTVVDVTPTSQTTAMVRVLKYPGEGREIRVTVESSVSKFYFDVCVITVKNPYKVEAAELKEYYGFGDLDGVLEIPENLGIQVIASSVFVQLGTLRKVIIPEGVKTIGGMAFGMCTFLEEVVLPSTVDTISEYMFYYCQSLTKINLEHITSVQAFGFYYSGVENISLPKAVYIGPYAFTSSLYLKDVDMPHAQNIDYAAFAGCSSLERVNFPLANTAIGTYAFASTRLLSIVLNASKVGFAAFSDCYYLESVTFNNDVSLIDWYAFANCTSLKNVTFLGTCKKIAEEAFAGTGLSSFRMPDGLEFVGPRAFADCWQLTEVIFAQGCKLTNITPDSPAFMYSMPLDSSIFKGCDVLTTFVVEAGNNFLAISPEGYLTDISGEKLIAAPIVTSKLTGSLTIPDQFTTVGAYAFASAQITSLDLNNVVIIEDGAFFFCEYLTDVRFTPSVQIISDWAFSNTILLEMDKIFDEATSLQYIGDSAFNNTIVPISLVGDATITIPDSVIYIGESAFHGRISVNKVVLNDGLSAINDWTFAYCYALESINFPSSLTYIGDNALYETKLGGTIVIPENVQTIGRFAFAKTLITGIQLPAQLEMLDEYTFYGCENLQFINTENIRFFASGVFFGCTSLQTVDLSSALALLSQTFFGTAIEKIEAPLVWYVDSFLFSAPDEDGAYISNDIVKEIILPEVLYIEDYAFLGCEALMRVDAPKAEYAGYYSFAYTSNLVMVTLLELTELESYAFAQSGITTVYLPSLEFMGMYAFTDSNIASIRLSSAFEILSNNSLAGAEKLSTISFAEPNDIYFVEDGVLYSVVPGGYQLEFYPRSKTDAAYMVKEGTIRVASKAVSYNQNLKYVTLPRSLKYVGDAAFFGTGLEGIIFLSPNAPTLETYIYFNAEDYDDLYMLDFPLTYKNFVDEINSVGDIVVIFPENGGGYNNYVWAMYFPNAENTGSIALLDITYSAIQAIDALPSTVTLEDGAAIEYAKSLYNAVVTAQKGFVTNASKLDQAISAYKALQVSDIISKLPEEITTDDADAVAAAREAYDALSEEQKQGFDSTVLNRLLGAEQTLADIARREKGGQVASIVISAVLLAVLIGVAVTLELKRRKSMIKVGDKNEK